MRILHFIRCFASDHGAYFYLMKIKKGLEQFGVEQYYLAYEKYENSENNISWDENKNITVPILNEIDVESYINKIKPDIIHFHDNYSYYIQNKEQNYKKLYHITEDMVKVRTIHDYSQAVCPNYFQGNYGECKGILSMDCINQKCIEEDKYIEFKKYINQLKKYNGIGVLSDDTMKKLIIMGFDREKFFKLPPMLDGCSQFSDSKENQIIFAGRLVSQKGVDYMLHAMSKLKTANWKLTIAGRGDGLYIKQLMKIAFQHKIADKVEFVGQLTQEKMKELCQNSKVMIFPSISHETYGFSGAEAISYGIPVIAFDIEGINEWLLHDYNGIIVPLKDIEKMAERIDRVLTDQKEYKRLHNNCIKWSRKFAMEEQSKQMYDYYKSLLNSYS